MAPRRLPRWSWLRWASCLWGLSLCLAQIGSARADDANAVIARGFYLKGAERYAAKDYRGALEAFMAASNAKQLPELQYNIGRCHEQLGELREALTAYRAYVDQIGPAPDADAAKARIERLEARLAPPPTKRSRGRWVALGVGVAGGAVVIAGAALLAVVGARFDDCKAMIDAGTPCATDEKAFEQRMAYSGEALLGIGGAAVLGAVIGAVVSVRSDRNRPRVWLLPTTNGLAAGGVF